MRALLADSHVRFVDDVKSLPAGATVAVWGLSTPASARSDLKFLHVEDGFLRSVGLGAELTRPLSWVVDSRGLYYDATRPSDLEVLLQTTRFTPAEIARAAAMRETVVNAGLTKYNADRAKWRRPAGVQRVALVPGQVESDASLRYGCPGPRTNYALVSAVRATAPDSFIVYKQHPDVRAGLREAGIDESRIAAQVDAVVNDVDMHQLLSEVDEVHVLTSLAGFEALLRKKPVTCHGQPFYAGWGLTRDLIPLARRTRRLSLDELVAGALLRYPGYFDRRGHRVSPEAALRLLRERRDFVRGRPVAWWRPLWRLLLRHIIWTK